MTDRPDIHIEDWGFPIRITLKDKANSNRPLPVDGATSKKFLFKKPGGTTTQVNADFYTNGSDGILVYDVVEGFIDEAGKWQVQAEIVDGDSVIHSDIENFEVGENITILGS